MVRSFLWGVLVLFSAPLFAQNNFEGVITVLYTNEKSTSINCEIKIKGNEVYIKQNENGNKKYDRFVINLESRELFTVSAKDRKVIIKYHLDSLLNFYDRNQLKPGFSLSEDFNFKATDKVKKENNLSLTKYTGETDLHKATIWVGETGAPLKQLIPFLRLLGSWNEADGLAKGDILEAEVSGKVSKKDSRVLVSVSKESVAKEMFLLPKTYLQKDFAKLMNTDRNNPQLKMIIQTFAEF
jgi:hypothetical protein